MLKEAIEKIQQLADWPKHLQIAGKDYINGKLELVSPPTLPSFQVMTLSGLVDLLGAAPDSFIKAEWLVRVVSHSKVVVEAREDDDYGRRECFVICQLQDGDPYPFGRFIGREEFMIGLMSRFVQNTGSAELLKLASTITNEGSMTSEDDGISQKVTVKQGIALKEFKTVHPRWTLQPYRTFREIEQPASEFVFRLRGEAGEVPECMLMEADGGKWKLDAVLTIKQWLEAKNLGLPVVA